MGKVFHIKDKKILLYGAGSVAMLQEELYRNNNIKLEGFIDKRGDYLDKYLGYPVYSMTTVRELKNPDDYAVVITIRNVFEHSEIAGTLMEEGFLNLVYKPLQILQGEYVQDELRRIDEAHNSLFVDKRIPQDPIPVLSKIEQYRLNDYALIKSDDGYVTAYIPAELLFTNFLVDSLWSEVNFLSSYLAVDLYRAFADNAYETFVQDIDRYIDEFVYPGAKRARVDTTGEWKELIIDSRQKVYSQMVERQALDYNFFIDNCPTVKFVKGKGFILISSGKNRVSFLIARKQKFIPVKMCHDDYRLYLNKDTVKKIDKTLHELGCTRLFATIPHPFFYHFNVKASDYSTTWLFHVGRRLWKGCFVDRSKTSLIWEILDDCGISKRYLSSIGFTVESYDATDEITNYFDELFYYSDLPLGETRAYYAGLFSEKQFKCSFDLIKRLVKCTEKFIFVYMNNEFDPINVFLVSQGFHSCSKMFKTVWDQKIICGLCYAREEY